MRHSALWSGVIEFARRTVRPDARLGTAIAVALGCLWAASPSAASSSVVAYVSNSGGDSVQPIGIPSPSTFVLRPPIATGFDTEPVGIAASPSGSGVYVALSTTPPGNSPGDSLARIDTAAGAISGTIRTGASPFGVAISPDGRTAVVADSGDDSVTEIDLAVSPARAVRVSLAGVGGGGGVPEFVAISPDGATAYVTDRSTSSGDYLVPVAIATGAVGPPIQVHGPPIDDHCMPEGVAVSADGRTALVACGGVAAIDVVDLTSGSQTPLQLNLSAEGNAHQVAIAPGGRTALVTYDEPLNGGQLGVLDLSQSPAAVVGTLTIPDGQPQGVAVTPDGRTALVAGHQSGQVFVVHLDTSPPTVDATTIPIQGGIGTPYLIAIATVPARAAPAIAIETARALVGSGAAAVELACRGGSVPRACRGTLSLALRVRRRVRRRVHGHERTITVSRTIVVGRASYALASGGRRRIAVHLTAGALAMLARAGGHRLRVQATASTQSGPPARRTITLQQGPPRRGQRRG